MVDPIQGFTPAHITGTMLKVPHPLTDDQKSQVKNILSQYDPAVITSNDAKKVFESFREAGIGPAAGLKEAITEAGFSADKLRSLARSENNPYARQQESLSGLVENNESERDAMARLQSLQSILGQYNLSDLS
ncbi:MAG: hypothetical protein LWX83_17280, partial [Anaerolineae bacterium]|nr:hypothetical protein [Anaerolineae bacterium]